MLLNELQICKSCLRRILPTSARGISSESIPSQPKPVKRKLRAQKDEVCNWSLSHELGILVKTSHAHCSGGEYSNDVRSDGCSSARGIPCQRFKASRCQCYTLSFNVPLVIHMWLNKLKFYTNSQRLQKIIHVEMCWKSLIVRFERSNFGSFKSDDQRFSTYFKKYN